MAGNVGTLQAELTADVGQFNVAIRQSGEALARIAAQMKGSFAQIQTASAAAGTAAARSLDTAAKGSSAFGNKLNQVGFQVQDFAVQIQGGQSAFVAFAQQGSQLASSLGGGLAGLGVAFAAMAAQAIFGGSAIASATAATEGQAKAVDLLNDLLLTQEQRIKKTNKATLEAAATSSLATNFALQDKIVALRKELVAAQVGLTTGTVFDPLGNASTGSTSESGSLAAFADVQRIQAELSSVQGQLAELEGLGQRVNAELSKTGTLPGFDPLPKAPKAPKLETDALDAALARVRGGEAGVRDQQAQEAADRYNDLLREGERVTRDAATADERYAETLQRLNELRDAGAISTDTYARAAENAKNALGKSEFREISLIFDRLGSSLADAALGFDNLADAGKNAIKAIAKAILEQTVIQPAVSAGTSLLKSIDFGSIFGSIFGGARAMGGPVSAGSAYLVGERGPELFMPGGSGSIVSNDRLAGMGGGGGMVVNVDARGSAPGESARIAAAVQTAVRLSQAEWQNQLRRSPALRSAVRRV